MAITWVQGDTYDVLPLNLKTSPGQALDLTGVANANITVRVKRKDGRPPAVFTALAGTATVVTAAAGTINFQFADTDVDMPGEYKLLVSVVMTNGKSWKSLPIDFTVLEG